MTTMFQVIAGGLSGLFVMLGLFALVVAAGGGRMRTLAETPRGALRRRSRAVAPDPR